MMAWQALFPLVMLRLLASRALLPVQVLQLTLCSHTREHIVIA
jgi:hypothetical protein